jgi:type VI secretion system protein ImpM
MAADGEVTGWYGKLPSLGDFASRRLAPSFVEPWDDWLAAGLAAWREQSPEGWLDAYLASPSWRFVLMPGCLRSGPAALHGGPGGPGGDTGAWAGVLMPSVDRVGRYFPLTLVRALPVLPADAAQLEGLQRWLHRLDDLALDVLHDDWTVEQLEAELPRLGHWSPPASASASPSPHLALAGLEVMVDVDASVGVATWLAASARRGLLDALQGCALWLSDDGAGAPALRITRGLPRGADFSTLLTRSPAASAATLSTDEDSHE